MAAAVAAAPPERAAAEERAPDASAGAALRALRVEVRGCLSDEKICEVEVAAGSDVMDLKMAVERRTGIAQAAQRLLLRGDQLADHRELREFGREASALEMRLVVVDPEWVKVCNGLEYGMLRLQDTSEDLRADVDVVLAAVRGRGLALEHAAEELRAQRQVVLTAVRQNGLALKFVAEALRDDMEVVLTAVTSDGLALEFASPALRAHRQVVVAAVRQNGFALRFAVDFLRDDREVVLEAVRSDGRALTYASAALKRDREIIVTACSDNNEASADVPEEMMKDPEVIMALMEGIRIGGDMGAVISWGVDYLSGMRKSYALSLENTWTDEDDPDFCSDVEPEE